MGRCMKISLVVLLIGLLVITTAATQEKQEKRGFLFQLGIGIADMQWPDDINADLDSFVDLNDSNRVKIHLNIGAGWALTQQIYVVGTVQGYGDRVEGVVSEFLQVNAYLYGFGLRWYPFTTGLELGADAGAARTVTLSNLYEDEVSEWGGGAGFSIAYDFNRQKTGFSAALGLRGDGMQIEGRNILTASIFLNLMAK